MNKEHFEETLKAIQSDHSREMSEMEEKMAGEKKEQEEEAKKRREVEVESLKREIKGLISQLEVSFAGVVFCGGLYGITAEACGSSEKIATPSKRAAVDLDRRI